MDYPELTKAILKQLALTHPYTQEPPRRVKKRAELAKAFLSEYCRGKQGEKVFVIGHSVFFSHFTSRQTGEDEAAEYVYLENCEMLRANKFL